MPFQLEILEPKYLSREPLTTKLGDDHLEAVFNSTAVNVIRQLSCLTTVAQRIFLDLNVQLKEIQNKTEKLQGKVANVDIIVSQLDAKKAEIPAGNLDEFSRLRVHYSSSQNVDKGLFTANSRPEKIRRIYEAAIPSPIRIVRSIDHYRKDGQLSSSLFLCMPFFKDIRVPYDVNIEMRRPASLSSAVWRGYRSDGDDSLDVLDTSRGEEDNDQSVDKSLDSAEGNLNEDVTLLPTPAEKIYVDSLKFPHVDVTVDVSGNNFRRMSSLRRSFIHQIEQFGSKRKKKRTKTGEKTTDTVKKNQSGKLNDGASTSGETVKNQKKENKEVQTCFDEAKEKSIGFSRWFQRKPRSRNSIIGGIAIYEELDRVKKSKRRSIAGSLWIQSSSHSSSSCSPSKSSTDSAVATGTSSVSDTNLATLKSAGVKLRPHGKSHRVKREDGGQSSSGNWSASSSTRTSMESEDPIISTANADENQLLLMTTTATLPRCYGRAEKRWDSSQCSSRKTSLASERSSKKERCYESSSGYLSDGPHHRLSFARRSLPPRMANSATVTARWLRSLEEEGGGPLCSETTDATSSTGTITPRIHRRQRPISPLGFIDDGESSEFSVDTDGYYTSMHTDSGLRQLPQVDEQITSRLSDLREQGSNSTISSVSSGRSSSSFSSKKATTSSEDTSNKDSVEAAALPSETTDNTAKKVPPPPPPRTSNISNNAIIETSFESSVGDDDRSRKVSTASDSDADAGERLQSKTKMNSERIPSLCVVTPSASDEEEEIADVNKASANALVPTTDTKINSWSSVKSSYSSLPRITSDKDIWSRDQRAYRTLPRNYSRDSSQESKLNEKQLPSPNENQNRVAALNLISANNSSASQRSGAHVTLDPSGKVIHVTNSLPRRFNSTNSSVSLPNGRLPQSTTTWSTAPINQTPIVHDTAVNSNISVPVTQRSNVVGYPTSSFPRWRPNHSPNYPNTSTDMTQRRWNNFGFLKREPNQPSKSPVGAYVRMDGHPEHLEPGLISKSTSNRGSNNTSLEGSASNEELSGSVNVPTPPAAMPLLRNINYGHASRIPTRTMPMITNYNGLPPYYSPVEMNCSPIYTSSTNGPIVLDGKVRGPVPNYKSLPPYVPKNPPVMHSTPSRPPPPPSPSSYSRVNAHDGRLIPSSSFSHSGQTVKTGTVQRALFPPHSTADPQLSRPLNINTYQRPMLPNSTPHAISPKRTPPIMPQSPSPQLCNGSPSQASGKMSMTTDELFAAIHQSKKKMNIKTDLDTSISPTATTSSSRSNSPCLKSPEKPSNKPETGSLNLRTCSPPNVGTEARKAGDRRSWAMGDLTSPVSTPIEGRPAGDRRSWASDRLGPSKPTSLHDFKMLLLQAGRGNTKLSSSDGSPNRKSAAEMLKTGSPSASSNTLPSMSSSAKPRYGHQPLSTSTIPGRSPSPKTLSNGHLSLTRNRMRSNCPVFHNRTDILSTPIPEDEGSEDEYQGQQPLKSPVATNGSYPVNVIPVMVAR